METAGLAAGMALLFAGLLLACRGRGMGLECAGIWLLLSQPGIVKRRVCCKIQPLCRCEDK
jgi:hypothetical protein